MHAPAVEPGETETVLVYRNLETGKLHEFSLEDTAWQDAGKWEWVDTRTTDEMPAIRPLMSEFSLRDAEGDATEEILTAPGRVYMLCVTSFDRLPRACAKRFAKVIQRAAEEHVPRRLPHAAAAVRRHLPRFRIGAKYGAIT